MLIFDQKGNCMLILGIFPFFGGNFSKGQVALTKQMNFRQRSKGGGSFSIQKFMLQILVLLTGLFERAGWLLVLAEQ